MRKLGFAFLFVALGIAGIFAAFSTSDPLSDAEEALKDRDYPKAIELLKKAHDQAPAGRDRILYLWATAHQQAGQHAEGIAVCDRLVREHPASPWISKTLFKKGDLLAAKKEHELAAKLYEERVKAIASPERRKPLAMIYVNAAREFLNPKEAGDPTFVANYVAAHRLLTKSLDLDALGADEAAVRSDVITCEFKGNFDRNQLLKSCDTFLEKFPKAGNVEEIRLTRGRALAQLGRWWEARKQWLDVPKAEALWEIAQIEPGPRGLTALRDLVAKYPTAEIASLAAMTLADRLAAVEDLRAEALAAYRDVVAKFPKDERAPAALIRSAELEAADERLDDAVATLEGFLKTYTESARWEEVRRRISDLRFLKPHRAFLRKDFTAARKLFEDFVTLYPVDGRAAQIALLLGDMLREEKKPKEAIDQYRRVAARYPGTHEAVRAGTAAGEILEELEDFDAAIKEYQKAGAHAKINELRGKSVYLESERVFTTTDAPAATLSVRNFTKVQFRLWTLDLKDYFEKKASTAGLHAVEVAVIAPDHEWEVEVKDFKKFKRHKFAVPLPTKAAGAYIVQAKAENLEATTVVLVSDLAFIAKAGRRGITLLGMDMRRNEGLDTVPFRAAADGKIVKDGREFPKEINPNRVAVLAEVLTNFAFRDFDLSCVGTPLQRAPIALLLPDRWTYAPEDAVQLRIVVRDAVENAWVVPKDKTYRLTATASNGLVLFERDLKLSSQGTAHETLELFPGLGSVRFDVHEITKPTMRLIGQSAVSIGRVASKDVRFDFLMEDRTYFFGDDVDVTIVLRDPVGRPVRNRKFRYHVAGTPEWKDAVTGADGGFALKLTETEQFERCGCFVETQFGGVRDVHTVALVSRGFWIDVDAATRPTEPLLAGEPKAVHFVTKDFAGKAVSAKIAWEATRTNEAGERISVSQGETTTDKDGKGTGSFTPTVGGVHTIVLRGRGPDGMPVRASTAVGVSDDKDPVLLHLLSSKDEFQVGEPIALTVHSRAERGLAYVVIEGEKIEAVKRIQIEKGKTAVSLDLGGKYLKNFRAGVLAMQSNKFHWVVRDFRMKRAADMEIVKEKEAYKPGDDVKVTVKAKRQAEVWLQVAEHVLPAMNVAAVDPELPGPFFVTDASNTATFAGVTAQVSRELEQALARLENLDRDSNTRVMMEPPEDAEFARKLDRAKESEKGYLGDDKLGIGGGGGGRYGQRFGGKRTLVGGTAEPRPVFQGWAMTDAQGEAAFTFRLPLENTQYTIRAYAIDASNAISTLSTEIKAHADVTVELAVPEAIRDGDKASVAVFLTNHSSKAAKTELGEVPARSVAEFLVLARPGFLVSVDGRAYTREIATLPAEPVRVALASGSSFMIGPEKGVPLGLTVEIASSTAERLIRLSRGGESLLPEAELAATLLALSLAKSPEAKAAALRLKCSATGTDVPTEVLRYLALAVHDPEHKPDSGPLKALFSQAQSDEPKALILFALSRTGDANFAYVNRLYRSADALSPRAAAIVANLLQAADRQDEAKALLAKIKGEEPAKLSVIDWSNTPACVRAFLALAGREVDLDSMPPFTPFERAIHALVTATKERPATAMTLKINGKETKPGAIDAALLVPGAQKIEVAGGHAIARFMYRGEARESTLKTAVKRTIEWPALEVEGEALAPLTATTDPAKDIPSMKKTAAGAQFQAIFEYTFTAGEPHYYVIEESLPAGVSVLAVDRQGFYWHRVEAGRLRLWLARGTNEQKAKVTMTLLAAEPGEYRAAPPAVRTIEDPDLFHLAAPEGFTVLKSGENDREGYDVRPGELFQMGKIHYGKKNWKKAKEALTKLFESGMLFDSIAVEAARMMAYVSIELGESDGTVRYFEILKEKLPGDVVPFDKILAVGRAYAVLKEFDRARQVFAGTCDAYFLQEANVVGELEGLGRTRPAAATMRSLLREHPDSELNREMLFGFGQQLLSRAKTMTEVEKDPLRLTKKETLATATDALEDYLALFPADAMCDRVSLVLGSGYLESHENAKAEATGRASARRYPKSKYVDSFDYTQALALFAQKKFADALVLCDRLETFDYGKQANPGPEVMKNLAILMKAQIFHAKGELDKALAAYKLVRDQYPDAARALAFLEREAISMPEVTVVPTNKPNEFEVEYSGVPDLHVKAYKVNLTMLFLRYKGVKDASAIEVAGIRPAFEKTYPLQKPNAKRREKQKIALDVKDVGAYLVSVKAGDFFASGLFLKSDLSMSVQEEAQNGTVRVNVANAAAGRFEENVKVTFIGSADQGFKSEKTDLRGIAEAAGLKGYAMVIAERDNHYAFFRGATPLSGYLPPDQRPQGKMRNIDALEKKLEEVDENRRRYTENYQKQQQGVEVQRTK